LASGRCGGSKRRPNACPRCNGKLSGFGGIRLTCSLCRSTGTCPGCPDCK